MDKLISTLQDLTNADVDGGYVQEVLLSLIKDARLEEEAYNRLESRFKEELAEYRQSFEE